MNKIRFDITLLGFGAVSLVIGKIDGDSEATLYGVIAMCSGAIVHAIHSNPKPQ